jgi:RNA polymerase sigma factor for flagellar operon FliA
MSRLILEHDRTPPTPAVGEHPAPDTTSMTPVAVESGHPRAFATTLAGALSRTCTGGGPAHALWTDHRSAPSRRTRDRLAVHYRPLVRIVAHRTAERLPGHIEPADLVQSGVFGLLEAIDRFDPDRCARFESYAVPRIRGAVLDELRAQDWVPRTVRLRTRETERVREQLAISLRRTASEREVADALGVPLRELRSGGAARVVSVEQLCSGTGGGALDMLVCAGPDPAAAAQEQETRRQLWHAVDQLGERDRLVLRMYYLEDRTLAEIGSMLGVTESRVCQLHSRLVGRLRTRLAELAC